MNILRQFIEIIYPSRCPVCLQFRINNGQGENQAQLQICENCFKDFKQVTSPLCNICGKPFVSKEGEDHFCENCIHKTPFYDMARSPYIYEGQLMSAIHLFKYEGKTHLADSLGFLISSFGGKWLNGDEDFLIMPVPLHPKRLRKRGFNQALLLGRRLSALAGMELDFLSLRRVRYTQPQTGLKSDKRRKNVSRAFEVFDRSNVKDRHILLVDDVLTTGSTLNECSRALKKAGAEKVYCLVLARTVFV